MCADYGMPLCGMDIKLFVKGYLNKLQREVKKFKNNTPGEERIASFLARHKTLSYRMCQNIKRSRSELKPSDVREYFAKRKPSKMCLLKKIMNYDETNLAYDPGMKRCVFKRGVKYPERVINFSKGNVSLRALRQVKRTEVYPDHCVFLVMIAKGQKVVKGRLLRVQTLVKMIESSS